MAAIGGPGIMPGMSAADIIPVAGIANRLPSPTGPINPFTGHRFDAHPDMAARRKAQEGDGR